MISPLLVLFTDYADLEEGLALRKLELDDEDRNSKGEPFGLPFKDLTLFTLHKKKIEAVICAIFASASPPWA